MVLLNNLTAEAIEEVLNACRTHIDLHAGIFLQNTHDVQDFHEALGDPLKLCGVEHYRHTANSLTISFVTGSRISVLVPRPEKLRSNRFHTILYDDGFSDVDILHFSECLQYEPIAEESFATDAIACAAQPRRKRVKANSGVDTALTDFLSTFCIHDESTPLGKSL